MAIPVIPDAGKPWLSWAQGIDAEARKIANTMTYVGTAAAPVTSASQARPVTTGPVYWMCAAGITPTNAAAGDLIWNAS